MKLVKFKSVSVQNQGRILTQVNHSCEVTCILSRSITLPPQPWVHTPAVKLPKCTHVKPQCLKGLASIGASGQGPYTVESSPWVEVPFQL